MMNGVAGKGCSEEDEEETEGTVQENSPALPLPPENGASARGK